MAFLNTLLEKQYELYYQNLLRAIATVRQKLFQPISENTVSNAKNIIQTNTLFIYTTSQAATISITVAPLTQFADTYTPLITQEYKINRYDGYLEYSVKFYSEEGSLTATSTTFAYNSEATYPYVIAIPLITQYLEVYKLDHEFYKHVYVLKNNYSVFNLLYQIVVSGVTTRFEKQEGDEFDVLMIPKTETVTNYFTTTFNFLQVIDSWPRTFHVPTNIEQSFHIENIQYKKPFEFKLNFIQLPTSEMLIRINVDVDIISTDNFSNYLLKFLISSPIAIQYSNVYNMVLLRYKNVPETYAGNVTAGFIEADISKITISGATLDYTKPLVVQKHNIIANNV